MMQLISLAAYTDRILEEIKKDSGGKIEQFSQLSRRKRSFRPARDLIAIA